MNDIAKKIVAALDAALTPPGPPTFETLARTIASKADKPLATKSELADLARLQKEHETASAASLKYVPINAKQAWLDHEKTLVQSIRTGTTDAHDGWSRQDWEDDFRRKQIAAKQAACDVAAEAAPVARAIAAKFSTLANNFADEIEVREKADGAKFGLPFSPSATVQALRNCGATAMQRCGGGNSSPRAMLPYLSI